MTDKTEPPFDALAEPPREFDALFDRISSVDAEEVMTSVSAATDEDLQEALREFRTGCVTNPDSVTKSRNSGFSPTPLHGSS